MGKKNQYMIQTFEFNQKNLLDREQKLEIASFLHEQLGAYGDPQPAIEKAMDYALGVNGALGGHIFVSKSGNQITGAVVINKTGMKDYIPANILVYIATRSELRGQGIGKKLLETAIEHVEGDVALHVEPDNPAKALYERLGFTNKYLEMRLTKEKK